MNREIFDLLFNEIDHLNRKFEKVNSKIQDIGNKINNINTYLKNQSTEYKLTLQSTKVLTDEVKKLITKLNNNKPNTTTSNVPKKTNSLDDYSDGYDSLDELNKIDDD